MKFQVGFKANVTREQRQRVVTQAPKLEKLRVQESLYLILGQGHKAAVSLHDRPQVLDGCFAVVPMLLKMMKAMMPIMSTMTWTMASPMMKAG